nr:NADH dehydrogenase subunit 4L [Henestaris halophilus]
MILFLFMFMSGLIVFSSYRKHMLITLFSLEFLVIILFYLFFIYLMYYGLEMYYSLIFLVFSVCESALGLGILVGMVRSYGNDLLSSFSLLW